MTIPAPASDIPGGGGHHSLDAVEQIELTVEAAKQVTALQPILEIEAVIKDREKNEQKTDTRFVSIDKAELVNAEARERNEPLMLALRSSTKTRTLDSEHVPDVLRAIEVPASSVADFDALFGGGEL